MLKQFKSVSLTSLISHLSFQPLGWMGEEVNYKVMKPEGAVAESMSESEEEDTNVSQTGTTPLKVVYKTKRHVIETR